MKCTAIIVAGGMGSRLGKSIPKAFVPLAGKELFRYSLELFDKMHIFGEIVIVVPAEAVEQTSKLLATLNLETTCSAIAGGKERWNSVKNGVDQAEGNLLFIHDAARPFLTDEVVTDLYNQIGDEDGIITANPVVDTVRTFNGEYCGETVDRSTLIAVGTPQVFLKTVLVECYDKAEQMHITPTDEAMLLEVCGKKVKFSYGDPANFKVTTPADFEIAEALVSKRENL